ncbi:hypothetical protein L484_010901 [Morus notabilis]|uniref:MHD1 domain-containing protein n=1 Tax=Morus notabilis TaxID=981085 RepID=W9R9G0_9ROSA|nr:hypothetical protein L484_010901 [Morus notabilis]
MAQILRDRVFGSFRRHQSHQSETETETAMAIRQVEDLPSPFADLSSSLSDSDLRETAYEILVAACRSSGGKPLTYIPQSEKTDRPAAAAAVAALPSLQRSVTSTAASRVKKALGLKSLSSSSRRRAVGDSAARAAKRSVTLGEMMRVQMRVSEQTDSRIRRALLRVAAGQLGRRMETMVLPLELLQQFKSSDFPNQQEYEAWQRRNLKVLEAGLLLHPYLALNKTDSAPKRLRMIIQEALEKPIETGKNSESMQALRSVVMSLACRSFDGSGSDTCHWADGCPLNLKLYQMLLESCFDVNDETCVIEEVDEVLELLKKTWVILGINQMLHNLCFSWVLFHRYVITGQIENDLLFASSNLLAEVENDAKATTDSVYSKILSSTQSSILGWTEKRLLSYRDIFHTGNIESMQSIVSLGVLSAKILVQDISHDYHRKRREFDVARDRVDTYIRSSLRNAFAQASFIIYISELAFSEKAIYSPVLKRWHPLAAGVAVATLHSCYGNELKQFVTGISELTPDAIQVLRAADKLEKDLVQIAVGDAVDSDDGGKSIIREMPPYEAEAAIGNLVKAWIKTRVDRLKEWVDRNLQQEVWNPRANKEHFAPSAIEVLRIIDDTLEAFFLLPIPMHSILLPELMTALDRCLQYYASKAKSGCGSRGTFVPTLPSLTRCSTGSRFHGVFRKKDKTNLTHRRSQVGTTNGDNSFGIPQLCVRINTLQLIRMELGVFGKRIVAHLGNLESNGVDDIANRMGKMFELSESACVEGIQQLCEATAYKVVFHELSHVLWDGLYIGDVSSSRIEQFLQELEQYLEIISSTVHDRVRTRAITDIMKASLDGFLLVLLAGGPSRGFTLQDSGIIEEDFKFLTDLFWSNGDGLPSELIQKFSKVVKNVLPLYHTDTESLIEQFKRATLENFGSSAKSRLPLPPTSGQWNPTEPNTLLRVLCYRNDEAAAKFLKKTYNLPKKL